MPGLSSSSTNSSTNSNSTTNGSTGSTGASVSAPTFSGLNDLMGQISAYSSKSMSDPSSQLAPIYGAGLDQINQSYAAVPNTVSTQLASRGFGSSGLVGNSLTQVANAKAGSESALSGQIATDAVQQGQFGATLANQLLNTDKGTNTQTANNGYTWGNTTGSSDTKTTSDPSILATIQGLLSLIHVPGQP